MPARKTREAKEPVRYLLSADRKLQKISLKKMTTRGKPKRRLRSKTASMTASVSGPAQAVAGTASDAAHRAHGGRGHAIVFGVVGVVATVALIAASQPSGDAEIAGAEVRVRMRPELVSPARPAGVRTRVVSTPGTATPVSTKTASPSTAAASAAPAGAAPRAAAEAPPTEATVAATESPAPVTITGCLAQDDAAFWLTDTAGADAPRERSWKSGFLKKRPSRVELVHASSRLGLPSHVGHRVAVTGPLANREMQAQSLVRLGGRCG